MYYNWESDDKYKHYHMTVVAHTLQEEQRIPLDVAVDTVEYDNMQDVGEAVTVSGRDNAQLVTYVMRNFDSWVYASREQARRIWEWCCMWFTISKAVFPRFYNALRLGFLVHTSIAATKRVFSQLQYILRLCGNSMLSDILSIQMVVVFNAGLTVAFDTE